MKRLVVVAVLASVTVLLPAREAIALPFRAVPTTGLATHNHSAGPLAALSPRDVWLVQHGTPAGTIAAHWNGSQWTRYRLPGSPNVTDIVANPTTDDVWAVGFLDDGLWWSGVWHAGHWSPVALPTPPGALFSTLGGVTVLPGGKVLATGNLLTASVRNYWLVLRGDLKTGWHIVHRAPSPEGDPDASGVASGIAGSSVDDIWALDWGGAVMHFDGSSWSNGVLPVSQEVVNGLTRIPGTNHYWAVGEDNTFTLKPISFLYDGRVWRRIPMAGVSEGIIASVTAAGPKRAWAVGDHTDYLPDEPRSVQTIAQWDGQSWHQLYTPSETRALGDVMRIRGWGQTWASGYRSPAIDIRMPLVVRQIDQAAAASAHHIFPHSP
jgi:hypothetical protein